MVDECKISGLSLNNSFVRISSLTILFGVCLIKKVRS